MTARAVRSYLVRLAFDVVLLAGVAASSYAARQLLTVPGHSLLPLRAYLPFLILMGVIWLVLLNARGMYGCTDTAPAAAWLRQVVQIDYHFLLAVALISFLLRLTETNRFIFASFTALANLVLWMTRRHPPFFLAARRRETGGAAAPAFPPPGAPYEWGGAESSKALEAPSAAVSFRPRAVPVASMDDVAFSMLRVRSLSRSLTWLAADMLAVIGAFAAAYVLRRRLPVGHAAAGLLREHLPLLAAALPMLAASFFHFRLYDYVPVQAFREEASRLGRALLWGWMALLALIFCLRYELTNRLFLGLFFLLCYFFVIAERRLIRELRFRWRPMTEHKFHNVVIAGGGEPARTVAEALERHRSAGLRVLGYIAENSPSTAPPGGPVLGRLENFAEVMKSQPVDGVVFVLSDRPAAAVERALSYCFQVGLQPWIYAPQAGVPAGFLRVQQSSEMNFLTFPVTPQTDAQRILKRVFDFFVALAALVLLAPLLLIVAALIRLESEGPAIFRQQRVGLNGRRFTLYKFRTMRAGAEQLKEQLSHRNELDGPVFKIRDDPRVTRAGRFLRRTSLDELPQLLNVLLGDMSLVGPRPPLPDEVERYELWQRRRLSMKPGLTCLWQVSGRNRLDFRTWMELDLRYIDHWSWMMDLKILLRTVPAMFQGQ